MRTKKFKVIAEYSRFYLAESEKGYKDTFNKSDYKQDSDGYIVKEKYYNYAGGIALPSEKVNKKF